MVKLRSIVSYSREERRCWRQGPRCLICSKLKRIIGGVAGLMMAPRRSSGCGAYISELNTRRHRGRLLCLDSRAKTFTLQGRHRRFAGGSAFHMSFRELLSLLATQQKRYRSATCIVLYTTKLLGGGWTFVKYIDYTKGIVQYPRMTSTSLPLNPLQGHPSDPRCNVTKWIVTQTSRVFCVCAITLHGN